MLRCERCGAGSRRSGQRYAAHASRAHALGSCSSIDILDILRKQKLEVRDYRVTLHAEREEGAIPSLFRTIHLHYRFWGDLDPDKVQRAIDLSLNKYCSVAALLSPTARIESSFEIETTGRR